MSDQSNLVLDLSKKLCITVNSKEKQEKDWSNHIFCAPRQNMHEFFMQQAFHWATRSTCSKWQVGCVLILQDRVISTGYNGVVSKAEHCCDVWLKKYLDSLEQWCEANEECLSSSELKEKAQGLLLTDDVKMGYQYFLQSDQYRKAHREWSKHNEIHAEQNAILFAARHGLVTQGTTLYTSLSPCIECAKNITAAGISKVYYGRTKDLDGIRFLQKNNVECYFVEI